eukprot:2253814-Pyramimonas_sp.AAC.1
MHSTATSLRQQVFTRACADAIMRRVGKCGHSSSSLYPFLAPAPPRPILVQAAAAARPAAPRLAVLGP